MKSQIDNWNFILRGFSELAGDSEREVSFKGLASSDLEIYAAVGMGVAKFLSFAIDKVLDWYKKILEIQEVRQRLAAVGGPPAEVDAARKYEKKLLKEVILETVDELMAQGDSKLKKDRKDEFQNHLTISIRRIARFIDEGGDVEVIAGAPEVPTEPAEPEGEGDESTALREQYLEKKKVYDELVVVADEVHEISRKGALLSSLPPRENPILQLEEGDERRMTRAKTESLRKNSKHPLSRSVTKSAHR